MNRLIILYAIIAFFMFGCIGEDVVESERIGKVEITTPVISLEIGTSLQLDFLYQNFSGMEITPNEIEWVSKDPEIATITNDGLLMANKLGVATIKLTVDDLLMDSISVEAAEMTQVAEIRSGSFSGSNGYSVSGTCELLNNEGVLELTLEEDFRSSNGPGLYVYMSNKQSNVTGGVSLGELKKNTGAQNYVVPEGISLNTYQFVLIYCQPFGVTFGSASLN